MTIKKRSNQCKECAIVFYEKERESEKQWRSRIFCSMKCNNSGKHRFTSIFDRLERFQVKRNGCWKWSGATDGKGYGKLSNRNGSGHSPEKAHRVSYEKHNGKIQPGLSVLHRCDNPECTNPEHLFIGTQKDNMRDCSSKGRLSKTSLKNLRQHKKLSDDEIKEIIGIKFKARNGRGHGELISNVAKKFNVCQSTISKVKNNRY